MVKDLREMAKTPLISNQIFFFTIISFLVVITNTCAKEDSFWLMDWGDVTPLQHRKHNGSWILVTGAVGICLFTSGWMRRQKQGKTPNKAIDNPISQGPLPPTRHPSWKVQPRPTPPPPPPAKTQLFKHKSLRCTFQSYIRTVGIWVSKVNEIPWQKLHIR